MLDVKRLKEFLDMCPDDMIVQTQRGENIVSMTNVGKTDKQMVILSTALPIGFCKTCGERVYPSELAGYCPTCVINLKPSEIEYDSKGRL